MSDSEFSRRAPRVVAKRRAEAYGRSMSALRVRHLTISVLVGAAILRAVPASAATKDAEALELAKKAIYGDYLGTKFADAEKKLNQALSLCEKKDACSATVRAKLRC